MDIIGIDFGNEDIKTSLKVKFKSVIREVTEEEYQLSSGKKIIINGKFYIVGDGVHKYSAVKYKRENLVELIYTAIAFSSDWDNLEDEYNVILSMGCPDQQFKTTREKYMEILAENNTRDIEYRGKTVKVNIKQVFVSPEGVGAFYSNSEKVKHLRYENVIIVDVGALTTDIAELRAESRSIEKMDSLDIGTQNMNATIANKFKNRYESTFKADDIPLIIKRGYVRSGKEQHSIQWVKEHLKPYAEQIGEYIAREHDGENKTILMTGGGTFLLMSLLRERFEDVIKMDTLIYDNAIGYEKIAKIRLRKRGA